MTDKLTDLIRSENSTRTYMDVEMTVYDLSTLAALITIAN